MIVESEEGLGWYALGALAWLGFVAFILTGLFTTIKEAPFIAIPFFGVFLFIAWKAAGKLLSGAGAYVNFGTVRLVLERAPTIGGELKGAVEFESGAAGLARVEAELRCIWETPAEDSRRNTPNTLLLHSETAQLALQVEAGRRRAPFAFAIPASTPPSGEEAGAEKLDRPPVSKWKLSVQGTSAGGDLARSFVVEVLPAGKSAQELPSREPALASGVALVAANLVPLALVLVGLGEVGGLVLLYWAENLVIGFYTALRMLGAARGSAGQRISQTFFFCLHYGMFCLVHGIFVTALFLPREYYDAVRGLPQWPGPLVFLQQLWQGSKAMGLFSPGALLLPLVALAASHGVSFYTNYLRNGRYLASRPQDSFWRPYPRMVLLHLCIIGGGFFIASRGSPVPLLAVLVIGKTLMDLALHRRSNRAG